jgi:hypothetical protein
MDDLLFIASGSSSAPVLRIPIRGKVLPQIVASPVAVFARVGRDGRSEEQFLTLRAASGTTSLQAEPETLPEGVIKVREVARAERWIRFGVCFGPLGGKGASGQITFRTNCSSMSVFSVPFLVKPEFSGDSSS